MTDPKRADQDYCNPILTLVRSSKEGSAVILVPEGAMRKATPPGSLSEFFRKWKWSLLIVSLTSFIVVAIDRGYRNDLGAAASGVLVFSIPIGTLLLMVRRDPGRTAWTIIATVYAVLLTLTYRNDTFAAFCFLPVLTFFAVAGGWMILDAFAADRGSKGAMALYDDRVETIEGSESTPSSLVLRSTDEVRVVAKDGLVWTHLVGRDGNVRLSLCNYRVCDLELEDTGIDPRTALVSRMRSL